MNEPNPGHILASGYGFMASKTLLSAVEMGLFTKLSEHPHSLESLREELGLHPRAARDFLDALVALEFLQRQDGEYANTPSADLFLDRGKPSYIGGILEMANHRLYPLWVNLTTALRTGLPQNETKDGGQDSFVDIYADPARLKQFLGAMTGVSHGGNMAIAHIFPSSGYRTVVDVGTAQGRPDLSSSLSQSAHRRHRLRSTSGGFVLWGIRRSQRSFGQSEISPGSFFDQPLPTADAIMMGHILHDWDLETKRMLVRKAREALPRRRRLHCL